MLILLILSKIPSSFNHITLEQRWRESKTSFFEFSLLGPVYPLFQIYLLRVRNIFEINFFYSLGNIFVINKNICFKIQIKTSDI